MMVSRSQPCGDGSLPIQPQTSEPSASLPAIYAEAFRKRIGGSKALRAHHAVIDALQRFASATDCLAGGDVIEWFRGESDAVKAAAGKAVKKARSQAGTTGRNDQSREAK